MPIVPAVMFILRGDELVLINSPVERGPRIFPNAEAQKSQDERDLQDPEFGPRMARRAEAIFEAMNETATFSGARFLLVTRYVDVNFPSFNIRAALSNTPEGRPRSAREIRNLLEGRARSVRLLSPSRRVENELRVSGFAHSAVLPPGDRGHLSRLRALGVDLLRRGGNLLRKFAEATERWAERMT